MNQNYAYETVICPDSGKPITVARNVRNDPIGLLYTTNQISTVQREAVALYIADIEWIAGKRRAPSHGRSDITWRANRPGTDRLQRAGAKVDRVARELGPERFSRLNAVLTGDEKLTKNNTREILQSIDQLAEIYGLSTRTRH